MRIPKTGEYVIEVSVDTGPLAGLIKGAKSIDVKEVLEPAKAVGEAKVRPTGVAGCRALDLAALYTRPHNSMKIGGGDDASFATWFGADEVTTNGVPFLVRRTGHDVLVTTNNMENVFEIRRIDAPAHALHFLVWGYNYPKQPAQLEISFEDGGCQQVQIPLHEWTHAEGPIAFDFDNTVERFQHAAICHHVVNVKHPQKTITGIISHGGIYGLVAVTLQQERP